MNQIGKTIAALYCEPASIYHDFPQVDVYDEERDALTFKGDMPIIAHPPCRLWSRLRHMSTAVQSEKALANHALGVARSNGGIVEHPASSSLWKELDMPKRGHKDKFGGWIMTIDQGAFGHPCQKRTSLYMVGIEPAQLPAFSVWSNHARTVQSQHSGNRNATPEPLAHWLIQCATIIITNRDNEAKL